MEQPKTVKPRMSLEDQIKLQREKLKKLEDRQREQSKRQREVTARAIADMLEEHGLLNVSQQDLERIMPKIKEFLAATPTTN
jgi:predicted small metal-binding protein